MPRADEAGQTATLARFAWSPIAVLAIVFALYRIATLNHFFEFGAATDPVWFAGMLWRGDLALTNPPSFNDASYYATHFTPTLLAPALLSWLLPVDAIGWFAILMGGFHALTTAAFAVAIRAAAQAAGHRAPVREGLALAGGLALGFNGLQAGFMGLPHFEILIPGLIVATLVALAYRRLLLAAAMFALLVGTREDGGLHGLTFLAPLVVLTYWRERRVLRPELALAIAGAVAAAAIVLGMRKLVPAPDGLLRKIYVGDPAFAHLAVSEMHVRLEYFAWQCAHVWAPLLVMAIAAAWRRDAALAVGAVAPLPWLGLQVLLGLPDAARMLAYYYAFPVLAAMAWPALLMCYRAGPAALAGGARSLLAIQALVLAAGFIPMLDPDLRNYGSRYRQVEFRPVATTEAAESYRRFGATLVSARGELGTLAASMGVIAIAPYTIRRAEWLEMRAPAQGAVALDRLDTLLLFDHPLSCPEAETALLDARMPHVFIVPGTRIVVATRRALDRLPSFAPLLQPIGKPARLCGRREPLRG